MNEIERAVAQAVNELLSIERNDMRPIRLMVVGCSTSEIAGGVIGKASVPELGPQVAGTAMKTANELGAAVAFQCCEHLNRALVMERETAEKYGYTEVCAVPHPKAVAVPVRLSMNKIGEAPLTAAITRPKLIGGERAKYTL